MSSIRPHYLGEYQDQIEGMIQAGALFKDVEDIINASDLVEDQKAALWLLAWSAREPWVQRQDALAALELLDGG